MTKFITPVSMQVTKEQFEKDLKDPLVKMGYKIKDTDFTTHPIVVSNLEGRCGEVGGAVVGRTYYSNGRTHIEHYNPELFLALAAMTDEKYGIAGEWWVFGGESDRWFTEGKLHQGSKPVGNPRAFIDDNGVANGFVCCPDILEYIRKATKEELIAHFTKEQQFTLPEKWCIKPSGNVQEQDTVRMWFGKWNHNVYPKGGENNYYWHYPILNIIRFPSHCNTDKQPGYTEITFQQFVDNILKPEKEGPTFEVTIKLPDFFTDSSAALNIETGKFYRTSDGKKIRIYATDSGNEYPIHGAILQDDIWVAETWDCYGRYDIGDTSLEDIEGEWVEPFYFDWDCLPTWANKYLAMDYDGRWRAFSNSPHTVAPYWSAKSGMAVVVPEEYAPTNFTGDWDGSLRMNPEYEQAQGEK